MFDSILEDIASLTHHQSIERSLQVVARLIEREQADQGFDRLDWKIIASTLEDLEKGLAIFADYRHIRKLTIFGSARTPEDDPNYQLAYQLAQHLQQLGFMVITGAGGGIMEAGNAGAGNNRSFGLNVHLPFEQVANRFIQDNDKLIPFRFFFTRKMFFLRESDAIAFFPGGFGTQDESFETLTLAQTGRFGPAPIVLMEAEGGTYWQDWNEYIHKHLKGSNLISANDPDIYKLFHNVEDACNYVRNFYQVYHSCRYVGDQLIIRLNEEISDQQLEEINEDFQDIIVKGKIEKTVPHPKERVEESLHLPRLIFHFNQRLMGRLYHLIDRLNRFSSQLDSYSAKK